MTNEIKTEKTIEISSIIHDNVIEEKDLFEKLKKLSENGAQPITIVADVEPKANKRNNPFFGNVMKRSTVNGMINFDYEKGVQRKQCKEGLEPDFEAQERTWGKHITAGVLENTNKDGETYNYIAMNVLNTLETCYRLISENRPMTLDEIATFKTFVPVRKEAPNQGLEKPLIYRNYRLDHILEIRMRKEIFKVNH